jgi:hypothetical protein
MSSHLVPYQEGNKGVDWDHPALGVVRVKDAEKGLVEEFMPDGVTKRTKVALVGFASTSIGDAPWDDPTYALWGMNQLYRHIPRLTRHFEMHSNYMDAVVEGTDYEEFLKTCPIPSYMVEHHPEFPNSVKFPIDRMVEQFGDYFTSTVAFMLALAIDEGFERIDLFGIDLVVGVEYQVQKSCVEYLIGVAMGKGIEVGIPLASALLKGKRYGYLHENSGVLSEEDLINRKQTLINMKAEAIGRVHHFEGAIADLEYLIDGCQVRARGGTWTV